MYFLEGQEGDCFLVSGRFEVCKQGWLDVGAFEFLVVSPKYPEEELEASPADSFAEGLYSHDSAVADHCFGRAGVIILREFTEKGIREMLIDLLGVSLASPDEELVSYLETIFPLAWSPPGRPSLSPRSSDLCNQATKKKTN